MKNTFITTVGLIVAFVVLIQISINYGSSNENLDSNQDFYSKYASIYSNDLESETNSSDSTEDYDDYSQENNEEEYRYDQEDKNDYSYTDDEYSSTNDYDTGSYKEESNIAHKGETAYITGSNSYYHAISNCKYLEGAGTTTVTVTNDIGKYECNCWYNPVAYVPPKQESSSQPSSGNYVYISSGNSYYHKTSSCKFLNGASSTAVDLNNVGGKHPCNCIKY